ncbi:unnamed protein product [Prunus armeniaca]
MNERWEDKRKSLRLESYGVYSLEGRKSLRLESYGVYSLKGRKSLELCLVRLYGEDDGFQG